MYLRAHGPRWVWSHREHVTFVNESWRLASPIPAHCIPTIFFPPGAYEGCGISEMEA